MGALYKICLKISLITLLYCVVISSCISNKDKQLEYALSFAGENRTELEKVLLHYKNNNEKLEATKFLIRNMPKWYGYYGTELDSIKNVLQDKYKGPTPEDIKKKWQKFNFYSLPKKFDSHSITADYLINNIELAFKVKEKPWNQVLPFNDFCELILPYRIANEPLTNWREVYYNRYNPILDSLLDNDIINACNIISNELKKTNSSYCTDFSIPHLDATFLFNYPIGYCREFCDFAMYAMRACGIPIVTDFFIVSPDYQNSHTWTMLRDTTGKYLYFDYQGTNPSRENPKTDGRKKGKVYRNYYGYQGIKYSDTESNRIHNKFLNPFCKDVSEVYWKNSVKVPINISNKDYIYLGVFSAKYGWIPVDITHSNGNYAVFNNIEPNVIYQPLLYKDNRMVDAGYPFIYTKDSIILLTPDKTTEPVILNRKMSLTERMKEFAYRGIIGAKIEVSNNKEFKNSELIYEFKDTLDYNYVIIKPINKNFRYIKYSSPPKKFLELAEFSVFRDTNCISKLPLKKINSLYYENGVENIFDNNILTFYQSRKESEYLLLDIGKTTNIGCIVFSPRNDDNYISIGDEYELFYQDGVNGWKSLGTKIAKERIITFNAPKNALLWLRNLTKGKEEQVFIYKNNKQIFTIDL